MGAAVDKDGLILKLPITMKSRLHGNECNLGVRRGGWMQSRAGALGEVEPNLE